MKRILISTTAILAVAFSAGSLLFVGHTQTLPGTSVDRIGGLPPNYQNTYKLLYTFDNYQNRQIRVVYGNGTAASVTPGNVFNFPYGSIILFESWSVQEDANGEPILDANGRFIKNALTTIFMMRKEQGFGVDYQQIRNGEWEYVAYRPDGTYSTTPQNTGSCALCHLTGGGLALSPSSQNVGAQWDYVFRPAFYFNQESGAVPQGMLNPSVSLPHTFP